jgi:uncharacterized protein
LRLNVGFLINQSIGYSRDFDFDYPVLHLQPDLDLRAFKGSAKFTRTPQGLLLQGNFECHYESECVRCLDNADVSLMIDFNELYAFSHRTASESGLIVPEDGHIDLEPLVHEYLTLEIPIRPLCRPDCRGLCPVCGEDLNDRLCEHQSQKADA